MNAITPAEYRKASATVSYVLNSDASQRVRTLELNLTSGRIRHPQADDAEIARKIIAVTKGYPVANVCVINLVLDAELTV